MIVSTPGVCGGNPRIGNTRIPVWLIAALVWDDGATMDDLIDGYPHVTREHFDEALAYAEEHKQDTLDEIQRQRDA